MFGGAYDDARMPNWPHGHRTPLPKIATTVLCRYKGEIVIIIIIIIIIILLLFLLYSLKIY